MREPTHDLLAIVAATVLSFGTAACTTDSPAHPEGGSRHAEGAGERARSAGAGKHGEGNEVSGAGSEGGGEESGAHGEGHEGGEHGEGRHDEGGAGEESGKRIGRGDIWDATRNGARLVLAFGPGSSTFAGTVENTTRQTLCAVRVEVHLSTGTELAARGKRPRCIRAAMHPG